jgi:hypothetical protein
MNRHRVVLVMGALATVVTLVVALRHSADEPSETRPNEVKGAPAERGERADAVTAALEVAPATQAWLYLADTDIRAELDRIATATAAPRLAQAAATSAAAARESLQGATGPVWWIVCPLASRVETFDGHHATVSVWEIQILAARDVAAPQSRYRTVQVDLEWTQGRWLVSDLNEADGPAATPAPGEEAWDSHTFDQALEGFTRVGVEG